MNTKTDRTGAAMADARNRIETATAELLDVGAVAERLTCSKQHVRRLADAGRMPKPLRLGGLVRWRKSDIDNWVAAGLPDCRKARGTR